MKRIERLLKFFGLDLSSWRDPIMIYESVFGAFYVLPFHFPVSRLKRSMAAQKADCCSRGSPYSRSKILAHPTWRKPLLHLFESVSSDWGIFRKFLIPFAVLHSIQLILSVDGSYEAVLSVLAIHKAQCITASYLLLAVKTILALCL
jgi:hypothetical protein